MVPTRAVLRRGAYVGDVTALCALDLDPAPPPPPRRVNTTADGSCADPGDPRVTRVALLAGTGASLQWYDPFGTVGGVHAARTSSSGEPLASLPVFSAARVHGVVPAESFHLDRAMALGEPCGDVGVPAVRDGEGDGREQRPSNGPANGPRARRTYGRCVVVWGERRVALVALTVHVTRVGERPGDGDGDVDDGGCVAADRDPGYVMRVVRTLPPLGHWVHDVRALAPAADGHAAGTLAVGLADNAVEQWTVGVTSDDPPRCLRRVECAMRSMLYSLALRGSTMADLEVAGGTIFNEIQLWALADAAPSRSSASDDDFSGGDDDRPNPWAVLRGHEGSIMRVSWSEDGASVYSTSDDRTARVWAAPARGGRETRFMNGARVTTFGHTARVWDCQLATAGRRPLLVTAGEDCTVRLWDAPGDILPEARGRDDLPDARSSVGEGGSLLLDEPVAVLRGHRGRGVWRTLALRSPGGSDLLVTAGADASIKLWDLSEYAAVPAARRRPDGDLGERDGPGERANDEGEREGNRSMGVFTGPALPPGTFSGVCEGAEMSGGGGGESAEKAPKKPKKGGGGVSDSKGEYVRAVCLASPVVMYVATNRGLLHRVEMRKQGEWEWKTVHRTEPPGPIMCLVLANGSAGEREVGTHTLAFGDYHGRVVVLVVPAAVEGASSGARIESCWQATEPRKLLDIFWCDGAGGDHDVDNDGSFFTGEVGGQVRWWKRATNVAQNWDLVGVAPMPSARRVLALAHDPASGIILCGDQAGNIATFDGRGAGPSASDGESVDSRGAWTLPLLAAMRKAHGTHAVSLAVIRARVREHSRASRTGLGASLTVSEMDADGKGWENLEFVTGGRDGRLATFELHPAAPELEAEAMRDELRVQREQAAAAVAAEVAAAAVTMDVEMSEASPSPEVPQAPTMNAKKAAKAAAAAAMRVETAKAARAARSAPYQFVSVAKQQLPGISAVEALQWGTHGDSESPTLAAGFKETEFVVHSLVNQCELLRVNCGGWHRPRSLLMDSGDSTAGEGTSEGGFTFAYCKAGEITVLRRHPGVSGGERGGKNGPNWNMRMLNMRSHGREIHTVQIVPPPSMVNGCATTSAPIGLLTGSEDGSIFRALYTKTPGSSGRRALRLPAEVGTQTGGTAVRAASLVPECAGGGLGFRVPAPRSYILLTTGAKEVLVAWRVTWSRTEDGGDDAAAGDRNDAGAWELRTSLVASHGHLKKRDHKEWKKGCGSVAASTATDHRFMAVAGFVPVQNSSGSSEDGGGAGSPPCCLLALAGTSGGSVTAMALANGSGHQGGGGGWRQAAALRYHTRPVLSLSVAAIPLSSEASNAGSGGAVAVVACSGATDGTIAMWDLTALSAAHAGASALTSAPLDLAPVAILTQSHQSGVNCSALTRAPGGVPGRLLLASGGDDQTLRVALLSVARAGITDASAAEVATAAVTVLATAAVDYAHSSAIKGVWMNEEGVVATTGMDQRLRVWSARVEGADSNDGVEVKVTPVAGSFVECPEPEELDAWTDANGLTSIAVSGRGVQMFNLE